MSVTGDVGAPRAPRRRQPRRPASVRGRLTLAASVAAGAVLVAAAAVVLAVVHLSLVASLDDAAASSGAQVAALAGERRLPDPLPVTGAAVVQVLDAEGRVLASSAGGDRLTALVPPEEVPAVRGGDAVDVGGSRLGGPERYRVVGTAIGAGAGEASGGAVLVATSLADVDRSGAVLRRVALVGVPLAVAAVAALAWRTAGSALAPVEALRASAAALVSRLAAPAGASAAAAPPDGPLPVPTSGDEVARLAVTLNDALARVGAAGERQRAFVSDAAHELRSPLGSVRTQLEVALAHPGTSPWPEVAAGALADVERTAALVEDLLVLARLDEAPGAESGAAPGAAPAGGADAAPPVDLHALVRDVVDGSSWRVPVHVSGPGASAVVDARAVRRAVRNLVANAARHAADVVTVHVGGGGGGGAARTAVIDVVDDGPGIPEAERSRVFERFTRLDDARDRDAGGSGLGLSIVRAAVERQRGTVTALEAPGGGALLRVELPASAAGPDA